MVSPLALLAALAPAFELPQTLRDYWIGSDAIVIGRVARHVRFPHPSFDSEVPAVELVVERTLKGDVPPLLVVEDRNCSCLPCARVFPAEGGPVIAFLRLDPDRPLGLHRGRARALAEGDGDVYAARLAELAAMARVPHAGQREADLVEWLVRCVEHPATLWDGAFELDNGPDPWPPERRFAELLTMEQRERLRAALLVGECFGSGELSLLGVLEGAEFARSY